MTSPLPRECSTTELQGPQNSPTKEDGAGEGNRTLVLSLEGFGSTIELHPHSLDLLLQQSLVERAGFEPAYSLEGRFTVCCLKPLGHLSAETPDYVRRSQTSQRENSRSTILTRFKMKLYAINSISHHQCAHVPHKFLAIRQKYDKTTNACLSFAQIFTDIPLPCHSLPMMRRAMRRSPAYRRPVSDKMRGRV